MIRSVFLWYYDGSNAKAAQIADTGANVAYVKAGGDNGVVWIPGAPTGGFARPQWDAAYLAPLVAAGVTAYPWFYVWPVAVDEDAVIAALHHRLADTLVLNAETEWRVQSPANKFASLADANAAARAWVDDLRHTLRANFNREFRIGYSAVPSWTDFPYEGFAAACDFGLPQHYWPASLLGGEDQVMAHYRRAPQSPCVATLTACREYDDAGVLDLARSALAHPIAGLSSWEAGNSAWQADAMRQAFALLPADKVVEGPPIAPRPTVAGAVISYLEAAWRS